VIELRQMRSSCQDGSPVQVPVTASSSNFDLLECSDVIADVISEEYETEREAREALRPLDNLLLLRYIGHGVTEVKYVGQVINR